MSSRLLCVALSCGALVSAVGAANAAKPNAKSIDDFVQRHPRSVDDRTFVAWRNPERFTKNPDVIELPDGRQERAK